MSDFTPELKRLLREAGCYCVRSGKGDHEIWFSPKIGRNVTVDSKIKSRHTSERRSQAVRSREEILNEITSGTWWPK